MCVCVCVCVIRKRCQGEGTERVREEKNRKGEEVTSFCEGDFRTHIRKSEGGRHTHTANKRRGALETMGVRGVSPFCWQTASENVEYAAPEDVLATEESFSFAAVATSESGSLVTGMVPSRDSS